MTKYRLANDPDTGKPCMVSHPDGIYYSVGEVDREIERLEGIINAAGTNDGGTVQNGDGAGTCQNDAPFEAKREE